ncbi:MAG: hypothetical protein HYV95_08680 [Opitutae bacterium]|nr:hypothetical protein [Opitutae bacterium]
MKPVRPLLIALVVVFALAAVAAGVALLPGVQRWAVYRVAAGRPGWQLQLESVSADPASLALRGVQLAQHGVQLKVARLEADYSLFQLVFRRRLQVDRLVVSGVAIDATRLSRSKAGTGAAAAPAVAPGAIAGVELPLELVLGEIDIAGRVLLPGSAGRPPAPAEFRISGGGLAPGRESTVRLKAHVSDPTPGASVAELQLQVALQLKQTLQRSFDRIGVTAVVDADGPQFAGQNQLKLAAELARITTGESYRLQLDTLRGGRTESVLSVNAKLPTGQGTFAGEWALNARTAQLEPFFLGARLPKFDARGTGRFTFTPATRALSLQGSLQGEVRELEVLQPALRAIGPLKLRSEFDLSEADGVARLTKLAVSLAGEQPVLELNASGAAAFNLKERRLQLGGTATGEVLRLKLLGLPLAWARPFIGAADVSGGALAGEIVFAIAEGQKLTAQTVAPLRVDGLNVVRAGRLLLGKTDLTLEADAELSAASARATVRQFALQTAAGDRAVAALQLSAPSGLQWPVVVTGDFTANLPKLLAPWLPLGPLRSSGALDFTLQKDRVEFRRATADVSVVEKDEAGGELIQPLASVALVRPFALDPATLQADTGADDVELARLTLGRLPLAPLLRAAPGFTVGGALARGEFVLAAQGDKLLLRAKSPLTLADVSVRQLNRPLLDKIAVQASPVIEIVRRSVARVASGEVTLRDSGGAAFATLSGEFTHTGETGLRAGLTFNFDLPAFATQPVLARTDALLAGRASGEVRAAFDSGATQVEARATLNGLVAREGNQTLPVANLSLRAVATPDGRVSVQAPILLDRAGQRSDLNFSIETARQGAGFSFDGRLTGEHVDLGDALLLFAAAGAPLGSEGPESSAAQARALSPPPADEKPFWTGVTGQLALDLKSVTRGQDWTMSGLSGRLTVEPEGVRLPKLEADFGEKSRFVAKGGIAFAPGPDPYHLTGDFSLTEFDAGKFFKALDPARAPTVEGVFSVAGRLEGKGLTLDDTLDRTRGQFQLTSRQGVFRGLKRSTDKLSVASKAVEFGAALGSIFKTGRVKEAVEKVAGNAYYVDQLAQALGEFNYDHFSLKLVRDESLDVELQDISLVSPEIRLNGSGRVTHEAGKPLLEQPLNVSLTLAGRGKIEQLVGRLHELDGTRDELDYARAKNPVVLGGTLAKPDPTPFFTRVAASKFTDFLTPDK